MILITGATGHTGQFLLDEMFAGSGNEYKVRCFVRKDSRNLDKLRNYNVELVYGDIQDEEAFKKALTDVRTVIHIVNIKYSPMVMRISQEMGVEKIIFIHTTGMYSKYRAYAQEYKRIEEEIIAKCSTNYVILRPTMIYGTTLDHNMHKLINYIANHRVFPVFGRGNGLMQPVHARDLAKAIVHSLNNPLAVKKAYNISGGSVLSYRQILNLIAKRVNPNIRFIYLPYGLSILMGVIYNTALRIIGRKPAISIEQIRRLNENKSYSHEDAARDLGYAPVTFEQGIEEEIKSMGY